MNPRRNAAPHALNLPPLPSSISSLIPEDYTNVANLFEDQPWPMATHRKDLLQAVLDRNNIIDSMQEEQHENNAIVGHKP